MKLRVPPPELPDDDPFKNLFSDRSVLGKSIHNLLVSVEDGLVAFVDGKWGEGKTTFIRAFRKYIKIAPAGEAPHPGQERSIPDSILIDALAIEDSEDPLETFCSEISAFAKRCRGELPLQNFLRKSAGTILRFGSNGIASAIGLALGTATAAQTGEMQSGQIVGAAASGTLNPRLQEATESIEKWLQNADGFEGTALDFRAALTGLAKSYRAVTGFPLTIIIDELDRCSPRHSLAFIERIKQFFSVEAVCFLIFANVEQLESHVRKAYGNLDASSYLRKFADLKIEFPLSVRQEVVYRDSGVTRSNSGEYVRILRKVLMGSSAANDTWRSLEYYAPKFGLGLRDLEYVGRRIAIMEAASARMYEFTGLLLILHQQRPNEYLRIKGGKLNLVELCTILGLDIEDSQTYNAPGFRFLANLSLSQEARQSLAKDPKAPSFFLSRPSPIDEMDKHVYFDPIEMFSV